MADSPENREAPPPPRRAVSPGLIEKWDLVQSELRKQIIHSNTEDWQQREDLW